ncbi:zf-TFIIB domain-containing protein [Chelativorans salis]|uniref:Zf-TFIIB domain-containing protein n=1 Tax=Chelativorans salis TaxID=2978478 RepID=A0ABT2LJS2_9HYPH|nr:zf-TFIIB domain-containing protein [Chelativorans sp. EGI FJ00035]MCT7374845.1 zf-TFIIB domain-containing protein [Chelativorans sp. EGI FJ00035]
MKCPIDQTELMMTERQGIEIDYCPKCRGVWLDRGELDKLIERSGPAERPTRQEEARPQYRESGYEPRHKKRKSLLGELFDF